jgi:hypothetical protein
VAGLFTTLENVEYFHTLLLISSAHGVNSEQMQSKMVISHKTAPHKTHGRARDVKEVENDSKTAEKKNHQIANCN